MLRSGLVITLVVVMIPFSASAAWKVSPSEKEWHYAGKHADANRIRGWPVPKNLETAGATGARARANKLAVQHELQLSIRVQLCIGF